MGAATLATSLRIGLCLLSFYYTSSKLTAFKEEMKNVDEEFKKGGQRDWRQVLSGLSQLCSEYWIAMWCMARSHCSRAHMSRAHSQSQCTSVGLLPRDKGPEAIPWLQDGTGPIATLQRPPRCVYCILFHQVWYEKVSSWQLRLEILGVI